MDLLLTKMSPNKTDNGDSEMALLTQRDLSVLTRTKATIKNIVLKPVVIKGKKKYEIHIQVEGEQGTENCIVVTARLAPQRWASINKAIEMLEEYTNHDIFQVLRFDEEDNQEG